MPYKNPQDKKAWRVRNKERCAAHLKAWKERQPVVIKEKKSLSPEEIYLRKNALFAQGVYILPTRPRPAACEGQCGKTDNLVRDHCHLSVTFRGWLCRNCNLLIGLAHDQPDRLESIAEYIEFHRNRIAAIPETPDDDVFHDPDEWKEAAD